MPFSDWATAAAFEEEVSATRTTLALHLAIEKATHNASVSHVEIAR